MSELRAAVRSLVRMMPLILLAAIIVGTFVYFSRVGSPKSYESTSRFFVSPVTEIQGGEVRDLVDALNTLDREVMTVSVAEILGSDVMLARAGQAVNITDTSQYSVSANRVPSSLAVEVYVVGPSPEGTQLISQGIGSEANELLRSLIGAFEIQPLDEPTTPRSHHQSPPCARCLFRRCVGRGRAVDDAAGDLTVGRNRTAPLDVGPAAGGSPAGPLQSEAGRSVATRAPTRGATAASRASNPCPSPPGRTPGPERSRRLQRHRQRQRPTSRGPKPDGQPRSVLVRVG